MNKKIVSIISIICFCTIILIPAGIVLMLFYTEWKKKTKIILTSILSVLYVVVFILFLLLEPSYNKGGVVLPVNSTVGISDFETDVSVKPKKTEKLGDMKSKDTEETDLQQNDETRIPNTLKRSRSRKPGRGFYSVLFLIFMLFLIIWRNLKSKKETEKENPYVDTNLYKFPLKKMTLWPTVHFQKIQHREGEQFLYACESKYNMTEGDILITNQRFVFKGMGEGVEFELTELDAAASVSNTCFVLTRNEKKFYFFVAENQLKYALNILRYACGQEV